MQLLKTAPLLKVTVAFVLLLLISFPFASFSQQLAVEENPRKMHVRYLEGDNDILHFNLKYNNNSGDGFKLMVLNETGEVLFQNNYSGKNFKKKIKLARLTDTDGVTFLIRSPGENVLSYTVKVTSKVVDTPAEESEE
jgi:hypothetical protein